MTRSLLLIVALLVGPIASVSADEPDSDATNRVTELVRDLKSSESMVRKKAAVALGDLRKEAQAAGPELLKLLDDSDYEVRPEAIRALGKIDGPEARVAAREVLKRTGRSKVSLIRTSLLNDFRNRGADYMIELLMDDEAGIRGNAIDVLVRMKPPADGAFDAILKLLKDDDENVRWGAAHGVVALDHSRARPIIPVVIGLLVTDSISEYQAGEILTPLAADATAPLIAALDHEDGGARRRIAATFNRFPQVPIDALVDALDHQSQRVRAGAAAAIGYCSRRGQAATLSLVETLGDDVAEVRLCAAEALLRVDARQFNIVQPHLVDLLTDADAGRRIRAIEALTNKTVQARAAKPAITKLLRDAEPKVRYEAAAALIEINGAESLDALPVLREAMRDEDDYIRRAAAQAAAELGPLAVAAIPDLLPNLDDENPHLRLYTAEAIMRISPMRADKAMPALHAFLDVEGHNRTMLRIYAIEAVERIGTAAISAAPMLRDVYMMENIPFRSEAARAFVRVNSMEAGPALDFLVQQIAEHDREHDDAEEAIVDLGAAAERALPALRRLESSSDEEVRESARRALKSIEASLAAE